VCSRLEEDDKHTTKENIFFDKSLSSC
jgi:hypothetical protein